MIIGVHALGPISKDTGGRSYLLNFAKFGPSVFLGHKVVLFLSRGEKEFLGPLPANFAAIEVPASRHSVARVFAEHITLPLLMLWNKVDIAYFPGNYASFWCPIPYVVAIRSMLAYVEKGTPSADILRQFYRKVILPRSASRAAAIVTPSQHTKREVQEYLGVPASKISVVPHGIDTSRFSPQAVNDTFENVQSRYDIRSPFLLYVAALWPYKNHDKLIIAYAMLVKEKRIPHDLVLVGQGLNASDAYIQRLRSLIVTNELEDRVKFINFMPHSELACLYREATALVFPSQIESFGNPIYEAMACGLPVVCSNTHGFPEMLGDSALLANPHDEAEFSRAIAQLIDNPALASQVSGRGLKLVASLKWEISLSAVRDLLTTHYNQSHAKPGRDL